MLTCSWSGSTAPGAKRISAVINPVARSNSSVLASQPGKRVFCHSMFSGRTMWEWVSAVCGVTASMGVLRCKDDQTIIAVLLAPATSSSPRTRGPIHRVPSYRHWSKDLLQHDKPGVMGPRLRGDDRRGKNRMTHGALALLIHGGTDNWSPQRWKTRFDAVCVDRPVFLLPDPNLDPTEVRYAAVWKPRAGELAAFPNLRVIFNLGAGVDALIADASLPKLPIVRVAVDDLTKRMTEYVALHVLAHHRQEIYLRASQREKRWAPKYQWPASAISVGIMGLGNLGANAAEALKILGFKVSGWSRLAKDIPGVNCFHGAGGLASSLLPTNTLFCLLPLTAETRHILNRNLLSMLDRTSPLGAPVLINAGRGGLQNEPELLDCLNDGTLGAATLDVFETEPLPPDSPFWSQANVTLTPHNAADTAHAAISRYVAEQMARH